MTPRMLRSRPGPSVNLKVNQRPRKTYRRTLANKMKSKRKGLQKAVDIDNVNLKIQFNSEGPLESHHQEHSKNQELLHQLSSEFNIRPCTVSLNRCDFDPSLRSHNFGFPVGLNRKTERNTRTKKNKSEVIISGIKTVRDNNVHPCSNLQQRPGIMTHSDSKLNTRNASSTFESKTNNRTRKAVRSNFVDYAKFGNCQSAPNDIWDYNVLVESMFTEVLVDKKRTFECRKCPRIFPHRSRAIRHTIVHSDLRPFKCNRCHKTFRFESSLKRHARGHCSKECEICQIHSEDNPKVCQICGKKFGEAYRLHKHMNVHAKNGSFKCQECNAQFKFKSSLTRHEKEAHSLVDPAHIRSHYSKAMTNKTFRFELRNSVKKTLRPSNESPKDSSRKDTALLKKQQIDQTIQPKFQSNYCAEMYTANYNLRRRDTLAKPYTCTYCSEGFDRTDMLKFHIRTAHKKNLTTSFTSKKMKIIAAGHQKIIDLEKTDDTFNPKEYKCKNCPAMFTYKWKLDMHTRSTCKHREKSPESSKKRNFKSKETKSPNRKTGKKYYICQGCSRSVLGCDGLIQHKKWHCPASKDKKKINNQLVCKFCSRTFASPSSMWNHKRSYCPANKDKKKNRLVCNCCSRTFASPSSLWLHKRRFCTAKKDLGTRTEKALNNNPSATSRRRTGSTTTKKYLHCNQCPAIFMLMEDLSNHIRLVHMTN